MTNLYFQSGASPQPQTQKSMKKELMRDMWICGKDMWNCRQRTSIEVSMRLQSKKGLNSKYQFVRGNSQQNFKGKYVSGKIRPSNLPHVKLWKFCFLEHYRRVKCCGLCCNIEYSFVLIHAWIGDALFILILWNQMNKGLKKSTKNELSLTLNSQVQQTF